MYKRQPLSHLFPKLIIVVCVVSWLKCRCVCVQPCLEFTVCDSLTLPSETKDSLTTDTLPAPETDLPEDTTHTNFRKSSLPDKTSKPPVPVFRKRTSTGNCAVSDGSATIRDKSAISSRLDSVDSNNCESQPVPSDHMSAVKSNGTAGVGDEVSAVSHSVSQPPCRQQTTSSPSLLSAVLATSAASIAMITIQAPSPTHSAAAKQKSGNFGINLCCFSVSCIASNQHLLQNVTFCCHYRLNYLCATQFP